MIRTLAWKEYREQRALWIAVAVLAVMAVGAMWQLTPKKPLPDIGTWEQVMLWTLLSAAGVYGAVSGALALAGDREEGTLEFLDALSAERMVVWRTKLACAVLANVGMLALLMGLATALIAEGRLERHYRYWDLWVIPFLMLQTFGWATFFGSWSRSVLAACGWTALAVLLTLLVALPLAAGARDLAAMYYGLFLEPGSISPRAMMGGIAMLFPLMALYASYRVYCPDRGGRALAAADRSFRLPALGGTPQLLWLVVRQGWVTVVVIGGVTMAAALSVLSGTAPWSIVPAGLFIGVLTGMAAFGSEQAQREERFLAEQRLPMPRVWLVKVGAWLAIAVAMGGVLSIADPYRDSWGTSVAARSPLPWILAGFAVGHLTMLVFRKKIITVVVAPMVAAPLAGIWFPSLCEGDFYPSLTYVPPLILPIGGLLSIRLWTAGTLLSRRGIGTLVLSAALAISWIAAALWYRAESIVDIGPPFDVSAFQATLAEGRQARAAELIRDAMPAVAEFVEEMAPGQARSSNWLAERLKSAIAMPPVDAKLDESLDQLFAEPPIEALSELPKLPPGVLTQPSDILVGRGQKLSAAQSGARDVACALLLRMLQETDRGNHEAALQHWAAALAVSNTLRNQSWSLPWVVAINLDRKAFEVLDRWLAAVPQDSPLVEAALEALTRQEERLPSVTSLPKIEYLVLRERLLNPTPRSTYAWQTDVYWVAARSRGLYLPMGASLEQAVWQVPWEFSRRFRLLDHAAAGWIAAAECPYPQIHRRPTASPSKAQSLAADVRSVGNRITVDLPQSPWRHLEKRSRSSAIDPIYATSAFEHYIQTYSGQRDPSQIRAMAECEVRGNRLKLALFLFESRHSKPAERLEDLVPLILPAVPIDPFSGESFHYRLSSGERIELLEGYTEQSMQANTAHREDAIQVAAGQGIVWSVGPDRENEDGRVVYERGDRETYLGRWHGDIIFLVPPPRN